MKFPPYPRIKPSGVEWLGDVPEHWEVKRSDAMVFADRSQLSPEAFADRDVFHYSIPVVQETGTGQIENGESIASAKQVIKKPVVLVSKLNPRKATICLAKPQTILTLCSTEFVALNANKCELAFLEYLTRSEHFRQGLDSKVQSVTRSHQRANPADIYKFWNAWPTMEDQRAIVSILDWETGRIDRLVAKKRELIERLQEKRTALISRTVTRGLPPAAARVAGLPENPTLKASGLDWLGDIPTHWRVMRFRRLIIRLDQGWSPNANNYHAATNELGVLKLGAASKGKFYPEDNKALDEIPEGVIPITPASGDLLISRANTPDLVGDACVVKGNYPNRIIPDLLYRLRIRADTNGDFVCWFLLSRFGRAQIECDARGSSGSMVKLGQGHVRAWSLPFPPLTEQSAIAAYLDMETAKLDALVGKVEEAVERLQEYRTALITAAVTGKIDVRKEVAHVA